MMRCLVRCTSPFADAGHDEAAPRADSRGQSANGRNRERFASKVRRALRGLDVAVFPDSVPHELTQGKDSRSPKHRKSCSTVEEVWLLPRQWMALPYQPSILSRVATLSASTPRSGLSR